MSKLTKFEQALLDTAKRLTTENVVVVAVRTECWNGLSVNTRSDYNRYLEKLKVDKSHSLVWFNENGEQTGLPMNYYLNFPVRVENRKCLDAVESFMMVSSQVNNKNCSME